MIVSSWVDIMLDYISPTTTTHQILYHCCYLLVSSYKISFDIVMKRDVEWMVECGTQKGLFHQKIYCLFYVHFTRCQNE